MKKIFLIIFLLVGKCYGQTVPDSIYEMLKIQEQRISTIQLNLAQFHNKYQTGTGFLVVGLVLTSLGSGVVLNDSYGGTIGGQVTILAGVATAIVGLIKQIDSHKFIKRAGFR